MFKRGDRVRIVKIIFIEGDCLTGADKTLECLGKEGKVDTVRWENSLPVFVNMDNPGLLNSHWREEELERV